MMVEVVEEAGKIVDKLNKAKKYLREKKGCYCSMHRLGLSKDFHIKISLE